MNIVEIIEMGTLYEKKVALLFNRFQSAPGQQEGESGFWKEISSQKEKEIHYLGRAAQELKRQGPNAARITLASSREMEEGLNWITGLLEKLNPGDTSFGNFRKIILEIVPFELKFIYSALYKVTGLQLIKADPRIFASLNRYLLQINRHFKKNHAAPINGLLGEYPFLDIKTVESPVFHEEEFYRNLVKQKKEITLKFRNGSSVSGKLEGFDHLSLKLLPNGPDWNPLSSLVLKESVMVIQVNE
jgi:sRNA-binding regulator protein Hfq